MSAVENFPILLSDAEEESSAVPPCFSHEGINVCLMLATGAGLLTCRTPRRSPQPAWLWFLASMHTAPGASWERVGRL